VERLESEAIPQAERLYETYMATASARGPIADGPRMRAPTAIAPVTLAGVAVAPVVWRRMLRLLSMMPPVRFSGRGRQRCGLSAGFANNVSCMADGHADYGFAASTKPARTRYHRTALVDDLELRSRRRQ
jgi:hypothetical protein